MALAMTLFILGIGAQVLSLFQHEPFQAAYFYYYIFIFLGLVIASMLGYKEIKKALHGIGKSYYIYLAITIVLFVFLEVAFVTPTHLLYNDEYIYVSIAKMLITEHLAAVCSFSNATMCVPGTAGFIHQPLGWPFIIAIPSSIFGVSFSLAYALELIFSVLAIVFLFYTVYLLLMDQRVAILASAILAFTPLFMRYSMSSILDIPAVTFLLLSTFLLAAYMRRKSMVVGAAAVFSIAYMLSIKVDMISALAIILLILLLDSDKFEGVDAKKHLKRFFILVAIAVIVIFPALLYVYAASQMSFGAPQGQPNFSFSYLKNDSLENLLFWFGAYNKVYTQQFNSYYYSEFPITYTIFAIMGAVALLRYKKYRPFFIFTLWFLAIFLFYTSYYAGGVNYGVGDDVRYFSSAFPTIAVLAAYGFASIFDYIKIKAKSKGKKNQKVLKTNYILLIILLSILFGEAVWLFATVVTVPPLHIYPFAAERYDENFIMQNYQQIPSNCFVLTFKPPLWYILDRSNIYAGWAYSSSYESELLNMSNRCLYFDYGISCYINSTGPPNTEQQCNQVMNTFNMYSIASTHLDNYSWNVSLFLYKITGLKNSSVNSSMNSSA
jgi:hypothetical protein